MAYLQIGNLSSSIFEVFILGSSLIYLLTIFILSRGWKKIPDQIFRSMPPKIKFSVIVAARNEEGSLPELIRNLEEQSYPLDKFELIVVDDHSDIPIESLPQVRNSSLLNMQVIRLTESESGKKRALIRGVRASESDFILFTDADCSIPKSWIESYALFQTERNSDLVIGLVDQQADERLISKFFRLDFLSLIASGAGSAYYGRSNLCNGANLCVRRTAYLENIDNLQEQQHSGDDVFMLHALKKDPDKLISVLKSRASVVLTQGPATLSCFLNQRIRWASKSTSYKDSDTIGLSLIVLIFNLLLIVTLLLACINSMSWWWPLMLLLAKTLVDYCLLSAAVKFFGKTRDLLALPIFQVFYPFYVCCIALISPFIPYEWKNRKIERKPS